MGAVEDFLSERSEVLAWLGVLLMAAGLFVIPNFVENTLISLGSLVAGIILWSPFLFFETPTE